MINAKRVFTRHCSVSFVVNRGEANEIHLTSLGQPISFPEPVILLRRLWERDMWVAFESTGGWSECISANQNAPCRTFVRVNRDSSEHLRSSGEFFIRSCNHSQLGGFIELYI